MENAAFLLGILSVISCGFLYLSFIFGSLAILLGLLSRGGSMKMSSRASIGVTAGAAGLALTVLLYALLFSVIFHAYGGASNFYHAYVSIIENEDYRSPDELYQAIYKDLEAHIPGYSPDSGSTDHSGSGNTSQDSIGTETSGTGTSGTEASRREPLVFPKSHSQSSHQLDSRKKIDKIFDRSVTND